MEAGDEQEELSPLALATAADSHQAGREAMVPSGEAWGQTADPGASWRQSDAKRCSVKKC